MKLPKLLKLSKTSWICLSAGIFVVVVGSLGLTRSQQLREQVQIEEELSIAEKRISNLQVKQLRQKQEELQEKLDESLIQLKAAEDSIRQPVESIDVIDEFFTVAYSSGVKVMNISSSGVKSEKFEGITCSMITINAVVTGKVSDLIGFVISLNSDFTSGVVRSAQMSIKETSAEDGVSSANLAMVVYAYEGA